MIRSITGALFAAIGIFLLVFAREWHRWVLTMYAVGARPATSHLPILAVVVGLLLIATSVWLMFGGSRVRGAS